jgi:polyferredoxin
MRNAILNAFSSVSSSSITTIIGLLVLLMMSFTIGRDIGLVISKGVFFSLVCVFTVMPSLILWFDELVDKLDKDNLKKRFKKKNPRPLPKKPEDVKNQTRDFTGRTVGEIYG